MLVQNIKVLNRSVQNFSAEATSAGITISGSYVLELKNTGKSPVPKSTLKLSSMSISGTDSVITNSSTELDIFGREQTKSVSFEFEQNLDINENTRSIALRGCADEKIDVSSNIVIEGIAYTKELENSGGTDISSSNCSIESIQLTPDEPEDGNTDEPSDDPGDSEEGIDEDTPEVTISGPGFVRPLETYTYSVEDPPESSEVYQWESTTQASSTSTDSSYDVSYEEVNNETVKVTIVNGDDEAVGVGQKGVVVVAPGDEQARDSPSGIEGRRFVPTNEESTYTWSDLPEETVTFNWQLLVDSPEFNGNATLEYDTFQDGEVSLNMQSDTEGTFLVVIAAVNSEAEVIEQVEKSVSVVQVG